MARRQKIAEYRERLDRTLASPRLTDPESLRSLVETQIKQSSEEEETRGCGERVIEKRTNEVANFLDMLRSVSDDDNKSSNAGPEWKVKQDNEEYRVMYREGPEGSPIHTLLVEGYVDGPLDICLCISWETALYAKWWPQSMIPTFKILSCKCLQKVRSGEQISLVRVKVSWPLSTREAIIHYFLFEYFEDDMIVVLLNSVSDSESIDIKTDGFTNEAIPEAKDVVRISIVGGFALQKVTEQRSYFRTIANMDVKLDFVPPTLINFIARQLIGNGFKLYQKAVATRFTTDEDFSNALKNSLYARIREALYSEKKEKLSNGLFSEEKLENHKSNLLEEHESPKSTVVSVLEEHETTTCVEISKISSEESKGTEIFVAQNNLCEIEEELKSDGESKRFDKDNGISAEKKTMTLDIPSSVKGKRGAIAISPEVEQALGTLEKVISMVRLYGFNAQLRSSFGFNIAGDTALKQNNGGEDSKSSEVRIDLENAKSSHESARNSSSITNSRQGGSNSFSKEVNHNKIAPISPEHNLSNNQSDTETNRIEFGSMMNGHDKPLTGQSESGHTKSNTGKSRRRHILCCLGIIS